MAKNKHFVMVLAGDFSERLKIPRNFVKHINEALGELPKSPIPVTLADPNGTKRCVFIERDADGTYFKLGWSNFVRKHKLKENEFVLFRYEGNLQFYVAILDDSLSEREMISENIARQAPEVVTLPDSDGSENSESDEDSEEETQQEEDSEEDSSDSYESESLVMNYTKKRSASSSSASSPYCASSRKRMRGQFVSRRRAVTDSEKLEAAMAAFSFTSNKPYFMMRMTANMVYRWSALRFPMDFSKKHLPRKKTKFVLKNTSGQKWVGHYYTDGVKPSPKGLISQGWTHFARDNNLEEDDYCVFELVQSNEFLVHLFRVVAEVVPPIWIPKN